MFHVHPLYNLSESNDVRRYIRVYRRLFGGDVATCERMNIGPEHPRMKSCGFGNMSQMDDVFPIVAIRNFILYACSLYGCSVLYVCSGLYICSVDGSKFRVVDYWLVNSVRYSTLLHVCSGERC